MKKYTAGLIAIALATAVPNVFSQTTQKLSATKANEYSMVYSLPETAIDITLVIQKTVEEPGEFYQYAKRILNIDNPISTESTRYTLQKVIISTHGEPDPEQRYAVKFSAGATPIMILTPDNIPLAMNTEQTYKVTKPEIPAPMEAKPTPLQTPAAKQVMTEEMLRSTTTAKKAQTAADQLYALRQSRGDLLTGEADQMPPDGQSMQLILDNLNAQEAALTAMFTGTVQTSTSVKTITYTPPSNKAEIKDVIIARLSAVDGLVDADDLSGAPVKLDYKVTKRGEMPKNEKGVELTFPKNGFAYCIPGRANVKVTFEGETFADTTVSMAQAGVVYGLAPNSFTDKKAPMYLIFDPTTGAAVEIGTVK